MPDDEASLAMARLNVSGSEMVATVTDPPGWPMAYSNVSAFRRNSAMRSQSNSSELRRDCRPSGPWDPRALPVGEAGPVVGLAPHHQTAGGLLPRLLLDRAELLVLQAGADRVRPLGGVDQRFEGGESEDEVAVARGRRRRGERDEHPGDEQCHQFVFHDAPLDSSPVPHRPVSLSAIVDTGSQLFVASVQTACLRTATGAILLRRRISCRAQGDRPAHRQNPLQ